MGCGLNVAQPRLRKLPLGAMHQPGQFSSLCWYGDVAVPVFQVGNWSPAGETWLP